MAEHTPGPWTFNRHWEVGSTDVENPDLHIAQCLRPYEEGDANARLIAAAPEMLEEHIRTLDVLGALRDVLDRACQSNLRVEAAIERIQGRHRQGQGR